MHGRRCEQRHQRRHMWPVPEPTTVAADPAPVSLDFFSKDGRKIRVGECALFKPPQDSPPFIGIIRSLTVNKDEGLKLGVNWLYRPADVKLAKSLLEAAPNEIFYSFHKDEISAASLLHPCKVAFLRKGVDLPSGVSSFVCRRVYDIESKRLWWLTDQDYINERQEEVDKLLDKTRQEMHGAAQPGGRSPKPLNGPTSIPQLKPSTDSVQNTASPGYMQVKSKKRERADQNSEVVKRERLYKTDDGDSGQLRPENMLKSEIAKITERGGLANIEGVEKLVQLMHSDSGEKRIDLASRIMLVDVIAVTDKLDCLERFVQLGGLPVLDEWLQEAHRGKIGDGSSPKESDRSVEEFLLVLLRALDKLPVNLDALQTCYVGKSVNHLRSHKNSEIQKKARSLVDTWKKRVEAEMNMLDAKSGSNRSVSWSSKPVSSEASQVGKRTGGSSEIGVKGSIMHPCASKATPLKAGPGEVVSKFPPAASPSPAKSPALLAASVASNSKDSSTKYVVATGNSDQPLTTIKEEKSSSSSQSQNNSQSCSSDHARALGSCREDARSSTAASGSVSKMAGGSSSRHRKASNGLSAPAASGVQRETALVKYNSSRNSAAEKALPTVVPDMPLDNGNNQRLVVRLPNTGRSPARSTSGGSFEDPSVSVCRSSPPARSERIDHHERKSKGKVDALRPGLASNVNVDSRQGKDEMPGYGESNDPVASERLHLGEDCEKPSEVLRTSGLASGSMPKTGKSYDASFSSINALAESCVKFSEASASPSVGDELGMNLLASVAAGEISKSEIVSPLGSPRRGSLLPDDSCSANDAKLKQLEEIGRSDDGAACVATTDDGTVNSSRARNESQQVPTLDSFSGDSKTSLFGCEERPGEPMSQLTSSNPGLQHKTDRSCLASDVKSHDGTKGSMREDGVDKQLNEHRKIIPGNLGSVSTPDSKLKATPSPNENEKVVCADEKSVRNVDVVASEAADTTGKTGEGGKKAAENSHPCSPSEMDGKDKILPQNESTSEVAVQMSSNFVGKDLRTQNADEVKGNNCTEQDENMKLDSGLSFSAQNSDFSRENMKRKEEATAHCFGESLTPEESSVIPQPGTEDCLKSSGSRLPGGETGGSQENALNAKSSAVASDMAVKLDFDLNEGFPAEDGIQGEIKSPISESPSAVRLPCPLPFPMSSLPGSLASITVTAAAKGPFLPPENLLRNKGELGWKGSAATSAFRPAEPRRVLDMPLHSADVSHSDASSSRQGRAPLDIDLNVPDERVLEETQPQNFVQLTSTESGPRNHGSGGLDLDLNRTDEIADLGQMGASNGCRPEIPCLPGRSTVPGGTSNGEVNVSNLSRGFDLNNGPGPDEMAAEMVPRGHHVKSNAPFPSSVPALRMNSSELGNFASWFPPGTSYSAITIPSILPGRGEQSFPVVAAAPPGSQRVLGPPTAGPSFGTEIYRGPVLSSSPAVGFPSATPFQYPGFPFETSFPLSSSSFTACSSAYVDSSSAGALCFPAIPSQLVGPAGVVSSHYPRPYVVNLPGATANGGPESRKWGSQILDLNAGPGTADVDRRDERMLSALRQLPVASSQAMIDEQLKMYQMAGGVLKRKEPDGGWDADRGGYKQPPWK